MWTAIFAYNRNEGVPEAMREHLSWEVDLLRDGDARFGVAYVP